MAEPCWLNEDCIAGNHHDGDCRFSSWSGGVGKSCGCYTAQEHERRGCSQKAKADVFGDMLVLHPCEHVEDAAGVCDDCFPNWFAARMAQAWDEGHRFTGYEPQHGENPYGDTPTPLAGEER